MASRLLKKFDTWFDLKQEDRTIDDDGSVTIGASWKAEINLTGEIIVYPDGSYDLWSCKVENRSDIFSDIPEEEIDNAILQLDFSELAMEALQEYRQDQEERKYIVAERRWEEKEEERRALNNSNN